MCNLYSMTKNQAAIRALFGINKESAGNLPSMPGIFPDYMAPVVRTAPTGDELAMLRWGMPSP
jgi:putative SOS response-associated peptidase YedK